MIAWLKNEWYALTSRYSEDDNLIFKFWAEIETQYTSKSRHYHSLLHIHHMLTQAESIRSLIIDYDVFRFAIWYHDIIYKATKKNNEVKSAELAKKRLKSFNFEANQIENTEKLIISTQNHEVILSKNTDNAFLLDVDLSILGSNWEAYENYTNQIRKEYAIYPDFIYNKGRKKAMLHFLDRKRLFHSNLYFDMYEEQARQNIQKEVCQY